MYYPGKRVDFAIDKVGKISKIENAKEYGYIKWMMCVHLHLQIICQTIAKSNGCSVKPHGLIVSRDCVSIWLTKDNKQFTIFFLGSSLFNQLRTANM